MAQCLIFLVILFSFYFLCFMEDFLFSFALVILLSLTYQIYSFIIKKEKEKCKLVFRCLSGHCNVDVIQFIKKIESIMRKNQLRYADNNINANLLFTKQPLGLQNK